MDIDLLHEFAVLAEHLNYTTASKELHVSQSSLSRHITSLEKKLHVQLFTRKDKIALTLAGNILLEESSSIFMVENRLLERLKVSKEMTQGTIRLEDYFFSQEIKNFFLSAINRFHEYHPGVSFEFVPVKHGLSIIEAVRSGYFDVGILVRCGHANPDFPSPDDIKTLPLFHTQSHIGVYLERTAVSDESLTKGAIPLREVQDLQVVLPLRPEYGNFKNNFTAMCEEQGFTPSYIYREMQSFETLAMLDMRGCVQIALEYDVSYPTSPFLINDECVYLNLEEPYYATPYLLYSEDYKLPVTGLFLDSMQELEAALNNKA